MFTTIATSVTTTALAGTPFTGTPFTSAPFTNTGVISAAPDHLIAHPGGFGPGIGLAFVLVPLLWIAVIAVIGAIFGRRFRQAAWARGGYGPFAEPSRGAESTLAERFAQGDIDEKEYRARLEVLRANAYPANPKR